MTGRADLERAEAILATLIARDGAAFVPHFVRIESELSRRDDDAEAIARAQAIAKARQIS